MAKQTLYILYNADSSVLGKLHYGYRKILHSKKTEPECSACDITHGGLSFTESDAWLTAKTEIEASFDTSVVQWHRDELSPQVRRHINECKIAFPAILLGKDGRLQTVMDREELGELHGDPDRFVDRLKAKGVLHSSSSL